MPHKLRSLLFSPHHTKVLFVLVTVVAGTTVSGFALTAAYKPTPASELPIPLRTAQSTTKKATPAAASSASTPAATIQAAPAPATATVPTPKPATDPSSSPAAVAATNTTPGTGVSGLTTTTGDPPPVTPPTTPDTDTSQSPPAATCTNTPVAFNSANWSGYAKSSCTFTDISGSWTVPTPTGSSTQTMADAAWIGIGGLSTSDLIQVGTEDTVSTDGTINAAVFYELLPAAPVYPASIPVSPGDQITAALHETNPGIDQWLITITDATTDATFTTTTQYVSSNGSAEWIEEDPSYSDGTLVPFDNFGSITFTGASATGNGVVGNLSDASTITITSHHRVVAQPGAVGGTNSDTFTVTRADTAGQ